MQKVCFDLPLFCNPWCCFTLIIFPCSFSLCHCQQICLSVPFISLYSFLWPTHSIFFLFVCLIVFQEDLCGHDRNIIETVDCQWEYNNSGDKYSMWLPKNHQFSLKENLRRIFSVVIDIFPFLCVRYDGKQKMNNAIANKMNIWIFFVNEIRERN